MAEVPSGNAVDWRSDEYRRKIRDCLEQHKKSMVVPYNADEIESKAFENASNQKQYHTILHNCISKWNEAEKQRNEKMISSQSRHAQLLAQRNGIITGSSVASPAFMDGTVTVQTGSSGNQQSNLLQQQLLQQQLQQAGMQSVVQQPDPINALQHLTKQGMQAVPCQQPSQQVVRPPNQMTSVLQQRLQFQGYSGVGGPRPVAQQNQQVRGEMMLMQQPQPARLQMMTQSGQIMTSGQFVGGGSQFHLSVQPRGQHIPQMHSNIQSFNQITGSPGNIQGPVVGQQSLPTQQQHLQQQSPAGMSGSAMMIPSPSNLNIPSHSPAMQQHLIGLSPSRMSLASPGSHLGTPVGNPGSIGPATVGNVQMSANEEQEYLQKWEQLQKYLEPLKKMINKIDKDEDRKMDLNKMKNLLDILSDRSKRLSLTILLKCETVLERQLQVTSTASTVSSVAPTSGGENMVIGQSLFDVLAANIASPSLNHILKRTFESSSNLIHVLPPDFEVPMTKVIETTNGSRDKFEVCDSVQGEVAKLNKRFVINIDYSHYLGSEIVRLTCKLDDESLPPIPSLVVYLPKSYPDTCPTVCLNEDLYGSSQLFHNIKENMLDEVNKSSTGYSLTSILNLWEIAVKKSCPAF